MFRRPSKTTALTLTALLAGALPLVSAAVTAGCGTLCERNPDEPPVVWSAGTTHNAGTPYAWYESAPTEGPFLDFPPGRTYRFHHNLGGVPGLTTAYFSFAEFPDKSGLVTGSGNQATFEHVVAESFDVRNDTCSDVHLRVVANLPNLDDSSDAGAPLPVVTDAGTADAL